MLSSGAHLLLLTLALATARDPVVDTDPALESLRKQLAIVGGFLVRSAGKVPDADYDFKPTPDVRSFVDLFMHVASAQLYVCQQVDGATAAVDEFYGAYVAAHKSGGFKSIPNGKQKVIETLQSSFAYCDKVVAGITLERAARMVQPSFLSRVMGPGEAPAAAFLTVNLAHVYDTTGMS